MIGEEGFCRMTEASEADGGWGWNHTIEVGGEKVFVKRIPLTDLECEHPFSTRNLYRLPTYYNYGVGSAGLGAYRELIANIKVTNWVLGGEIDTFPLLYGYRVRPRTGNLKPADPDRHERYVARWGGNENISRFMLDRENAGHELVLFLEHFPHVLKPWLQDHPDGVKHVLSYLLATLDFLRSKGVIHFDAHFHNVVTDGHRPYLTDFGLVLDREFELSDDEQAFFDRHVFYDYGEVFASLGYLLISHFEALPDDAKKVVFEACSIDEKTPGGEWLRAFLDNSGQFADLISLDRSYIDASVKYRSIILLIEDFFDAMHENSRKDTPFPSAELNRLLTQTGVIPADS